MQFGVHEDYWGPNRTTLAATLKAFPAMTVGREFDSTIATPTANLPAELAVKSIPFWGAYKSLVWSFKPNPADVASGALKPVVTELGEFIQQAGLLKSTTVCIWHEPENDFKSGPEFVKLFNTVHGWLKAVDSRIQTTHAALGYFYRNVSVATARTWITQADVHSIDLYSGRSFPLSMTLPDSASFKAWKAALPAGARWGVSERGFIADASKSAARVKTINAEAAYLASLPAGDRPEFYIIWNTPGTENDPTIVLDAAGRSAVNALFAH